MTVEHDKVMHRSLFDLSVLDGGGVYGTSAL